MSTLKLSICKNNLKGWFALENGDLNPGLFNTYVNGFNKAFMDEYGIEGAKEHVNKVQKDGNIVLFIVEKKVPNLVKSLVNSNQFDIHVDLTGINVNGEEITRTITKPLNINQVVELVPYYHPTIVEKSESPIKLDPKKFGRK